MWRYRNPLPLLPFPINSNEIVRRVRRYRRSAKPIKLYIDNGTVDLEARLQPAIGKILPLLTQQDFTNDDNLLYFKAEGAMHNEAAWAKRVYLPLVFFFGH